MLYYLCILVRPFIDIFQNLYFDNFIFATCNKFGRFNINIKKKRFLPGGNKLFENLINFLKKIKFI